MKKILLGCFFAVFMCTGLFAGSAEDELFEKYVNVIREKAKSRGKNIIFCADKTHRIVYCALRVPSPKSAYTPEMMILLKKKMISKMAPDLVAFYKNLKLRSVYTYITTDDDIITLSISYKDL